MKINTFKRTLIQFSCAANKTTNDDLFAKHLLANIHQHADVTDIFRYVSNRVTLLRRQEQQPLFLNGLTQYGDVYLNYVSDCTYRIRKNVSSLLFDLTHSSQFCSTVN